MALELKIPLQPDSLFPNKPPSLKWCGKWWTSSTMTLSMKIFWSSLLSVYFQNNVIWKFPWMFASTSLQVFCKDNLQIMNQLVINLLYIGVYWWQDNYLQKGYNLPITNKQKGWRLKFHLTAAFENLVLLFLCFSVCVPFLFLLLHVSMLQPTQSQRHYLLQRWGSHILCVTFCLHSKMVFGTFVSSFVYSFLIRVQKEELLTVSENWGQVFDQLALEMQLSRTAALWFWVDLKFCTSHSCCCCCKSLLLKLVSRWG